MQCFKIHDEMNEYSNNNVENRIYRELIDFSSR